MDDGDEMDSLFEGMVLFTPSQFADQSDDKAKSPDNLPPQFEDKEVKTTAVSAAAVEPLDENLFSDLTIVSPVETLAESSGSVPHSSPLSSSSSSSYAASINRSVAAKATSTATSFGRQASRKKKKAVGLRIGYGRHENNNLDEEDDETVNQQPDSVSQQPDSVSQQSDSVRQQSVSIDQCSDAPAGSSRLEMVKNQITEKLSIARQLVSVVSAARKDAIRGRRKASENLRLASARQVELEKQLEEACEAEDFEAAERISENLATADREKQDLMVLLRQAESNCDAIDSKMEKVLLSQISSEEESASLLRGFSTVAEKDADSLLEKAEALSSEEMGKWDSSVEDVEFRKMELDIESVIVDDVRSSLNFSLEESVKEDKNEKELLCKKKEKLANELQELLAQVKAKEKEIEDNDLQIKAIEKRIADVVSGYREVQTSMDAKFDDLQADLSQVYKDSEALSRKKKDIDEFIASEKERGATLRDLARVSGEEAKEYVKSIELRKSLMSYVSKATEDRAKLVKTEEKLSEEVQRLQQEVSSTCKSLKELSSRKSIIQQNIATFKEKMLFIDKRMPELEAEKKVAAAARNFREAGRIAAEAKSLSQEKDNIQTETQKASCELGKVEGEIEETINRLQENEELILSKEKEVAITRFQRLCIDVNAATAERSAALELGDVEEATLLLAEAEEAESEADKLKHACDLKEDEELVKSSKRFIPMELVANLGLKQLTELAASINLNVPSSST